MDGIAAGLRHYADDSTAVAAILSCVIAGENLKLCNRIRVGVVNRRVVQQVVVHAAIKQISDGVSTTTGNAEACPAAGITRIIRFSNTRLQERELKYVAS